MSVFFVFSLTTVNSTSHDEFKSNIDIYKQKTFGDNNNKCIKTNTH